MTICKNYKPNIIHIFIPPFSTIAKLCLSNDKTYLFLTTILRFFFYLTIFVLFYSFGILCYKYDNTLQFILTIMITTILILTSISVILVLFKSPLLDIEDIRYHANHEFEMINKDLMNEQHGKKTIQLVI